MKRSFVFIPAILFVFVLLNSFFMVKRTDTKKELADRAQVKLNEKRLIDPFMKARVNHVSRDKSGIANIVFKSMDGGQTWQDISEGLPEKLQREGVHGDAFFANDSGLYIRGGNGIYLSKSNSTTPFWKKEIFPGKQRNITQGKNGIIAYNFRGQFLRKTTGKSDWSPMYTSFQEQAVRLNKTIDWMYTNYKEKQVSSIFETAGGLVLIGSNNAIYKSANSGKTWKCVDVKGWVMKMVESNGVLLAATTQGILRSTDDGENWEPVVSEGERVVAVETIKGGFAAIAHNPITQTNRIHISTDSGKTWNVIGEALQPSWKVTYISSIGGSQQLLQISSIKQVGEYLICGRSDGIFRSSDMGKTWKLLLPSTENKGFKVSVSRNVIYAIPNKGC